MEKLQKKPISEKELNALYNLNKLAKLACTQALREVCYLKKTQFLNRNWESFDIFEVHIVKPQEKGDESYDMIYLEKDGYGFHLPMEQFEYAVPKNAEGVFFNSFYSSRGIDYDRGSKNLSISVIEFYNNKKNIKDFLSFQAELGELFKTLNGRVGISVFVAIRKEIAFVEKNQGIYYA